MLSVVSYLLIHAKYVINRQLILPENMLQVKITVFRLL